MNRQKCPQSGPGLDSEKRSKRRYQVANNKRTTTITTTTTTQPGVGVMTAVDCGDLRTNSPLAMLPSRCGRRTAGPEDQKWTVVWGEVPSWQAESFGRFVGGLTLPALPHPALTLPNLVPASTDVLTESGR